MGDSTYIPTRLGRIAVEREERGGRTPVIFLHGVYVDRHLWDYQAASIIDRSAIAIDMPHHGQTTGTPFGWTLDDCAEMLLELLEHLEADKAIAIGHSWGSMTVLRAAVKKPQRFAAVGLGNLPLEPGNKQGARLYRLQSTMLPFRSFYTSQAAKAMFAPESLRTHPELLDGLRATMGRLSNREVRQVDRAVVVAPDDGFEFLKRLRVPALALRGEKDSVPDPPGLELTIVPGGHMSPLEAPDEVLAFVRRVIALGDPSER